MHRTINTPTGYFRKLGSVHVHVDAGKSPEILAVVSDLMTQSTSEGLKCKLNKITRAVEGRQRHDHDHGASYASHTPGKDDEEDFGLFSTIGFGPQKCISPDLLAVLKRILRSLEGTEGVVVESERVNGIIVDGVWREPTRSLIPTVTDSELGWTRSYTSPIEIHHAIDFEKAGHNVDNAPVTPEQLLPKLESVGILLGGMFLFEKEKFWSLRTTQFANYDDYRDLALAHHVRLCKLLKETDLTANVWTISEQILGVWKTSGPKRDENVLYVPQLAHWERSSCVEGDQFWVIAADFLGDIDPDVKDAIRDNLCQDVVYTYFVHSFADIQRLRQMTAMLEDLPTIGTRARDNLRAVLLRSHDEEHSAQHKLLAHDYFIANPHDRNRAEGYELIRTRSGNIAHGVRVRPQRLHEIIDLLTPLLEARIHGMLLPNLREPQSSVKAVMFTDLEDSTGWLLSIPHDVGERLLEEYDKIVAREVSRARGRVLKALGDGYMCLFDSPADAARCAARLQKALHAFNKKSKLGSGIPPQRVALESGDLILVERSHGNDVSGIPIARCARLLDFCFGGHILMSASFWDLAKDRFPWIEEESVFRHGDVELKGFDREHLNCLELLWTTSDGLRVAPMSKLRKKSSGENAEIQGKC